jgi:hypothetical protein
MSSITMYDSVNINALPKGAAAYAGYVNGIYNTWDALVSKFESSGAQLLSIDVFGNGPVAHCLDVESGDATNADIPAWVNKVKAEGVKVPVIYTSASNTQAVINVCMETLKLTRQEFLVWSAHYTGTAHICAPAICGYPAADATQWSDDTPNGCDASEVASYFFPWTLGTTAPAPAAKALPAPTGLSVVQKTASFGFEWNAVSGAKGYTVQLIELNGTNAQTVTTLTNAVVLNNLTVGWQYNVHVWANGGPVAPPHASITITV